MSATIAAVVVRYRGGSEVQRCLQSLADHGGPRLAQTILVDSGSADGGIECLRGDFPEVSFVELEENRSFAWAANHGAELAKADLLLLLNPDAEVLPGSVDILADHLELNSEAAGVVPLLVNENGNPQHRWQLRRLPGPLRLTLGFPGAPAFSRPPVEPRPVAQPAAAAWLLPQRVWKGLGGFDTDFQPAWWEDVDFCARLSGDHGFWVVPDARIQHLGGSSVNSLSDARFLTIFHRNLLRYAERHHPHRIAFIRFGLRCSLSARAVVRPSRRAAYLQALRKINLR